MTLPCRLSSGGSITYREYNATTHKYRDTERIHDKQKRRRSKLSQIYNSK
jgi:hypothetical protein